MSYLNNTQSTIFGITAFVSGRSGCPPFPAPPPQRSVWCPPEAVYVALGVDSRVLYVGLTNSPGQRWKKHRSQRRSASPWFGQACTWAVVWVEDRYAARVLEKDLIQKLEPVYNKIGGADRELPCR